jgi:hypothetical protein
LIRQENSDIAFHPFPQKARNWMGALTVFIDPAHKICNVLSHPATKTKTSRGWGTLTVFSCRINSAAGDFLSPVLPNRLSLASKKN